MDASFWRRAKEVVQAALARPPAERAAFTSQRCGPDSTLRTEVDSLLTAIDQAGSFIDRPALLSPPLSAVLANGWPADETRHALEPGTSLGCYTVIEFIGAGGMGQVYRAHDASLNRDVALKVCPAGVPVDADRLPRVNREAQMLAALNDPTIAAIYGLENSDGAPVLVLEFVDGPTLQMRLESGRMRIDEALSIATQIAKGLEAAHDRGIIHSDLKPANIKLRPNGAVKILDFGLARMIDTVDMSASASDPAAGPSPAVSHTGPIFGTAAYMSPEQARGQTVDERTDIWAFGCVLYEALVGRPAFHGETVDEILAAVIGKEPDWSLLPTDTPAAIVRVVRKCLEKNADRRLHHIADARIEIEDASATTAPAVPRKRFWPVAVGGAAIAAVAIGLAFRTSVWPSSAAPAVAIKRLQIRLPEAGPLAGASSMPLGLAQLSMAIAPDGSRVVYVLEHQGVTRLYLHALDQLEPAVIRATEGAFGPFFSPDGRWIGFFADNKLKKVSVSGGEPIVLGDAPNPYGGSWGTDGTILFSPNEGQRPTRIPESGGTARLIDVRNLFGSYRRPDLLPGGKAAIVSNPMLGVGVLSFETGEFRLLVARAGGGRYAAGHLLFARPNTLLAAPFDLKQLAITGPEAVILEGVRTEAEGVTAQPQAVLSAEGTLVYAAGQGPGNMTRPMWVDRRGKVEPVGMPPRSYQTMSLSPDGRFLAIIIADPANDVWVQDLERGTLTRRTSGADPSAVGWTQDGQRILFGSRREGGRQAFSVPKDGSSGPEPFVTGDGQPAIGSFSPDGRFVATFKRDPVTGMDLWVLPMRPQQVIQPFLRTPFNEVGPRFSPDGRWIAYVSDESGQYEVYVRPYPPRSGKWQLSTDGGDEPTWSDDGKEVFYRNGRKWMVAAVNPKAEFTARKPKLVFEGPYANIGGRSYDVVSGRRFLVLEPVGPDLLPVTHLNVVLNWQRLAGLNPLPAIRDAAGSDPSR